MQDKEIRDILNYYLEYEVYNILNSSQIKIDNKKSFILSAINGNEICEVLIKLKHEKIKEELKTILRKDMLNRQQLVDYINLELKSVCEENKSQVAFRIEELIKEKINYNLDNKLLKNFTNKLCEIQLYDEFFLYSHNVTYMSENIIRKLPMFIFRCEIESEDISILEVNINEVTLNTILSVILNKEMSEVSVEYEEQISIYKEEIKNEIDCGDIKHLLELFYLKFEAIFSISREKIEKICNIDNKYNIHKEYVMSIDELADGSIKNIKEDIELLIKLIDNDISMPRILSKYLIENKMIKNDINNTKYTQCYYGSYKSKYGVNENQYKIVNAVKDNDLIAIEGPPGTGKTSLLKEIISNNITQRANLILKNWNEKFETKTYNKTKYYDVSWYDNENVIKSIVVSSKNGEAIENVGKEMNKEIKYMYPIARKYERTKKENGKNKKIVQNYIGMVCLPLGKKNNIIDFQEFLYKKYIPLLNKLKGKENINDFLEFIKRKYEDKFREVINAKRVIKELEKIRDKSKYFYGKDINDKEIKEIFICDKKEKEECIKKVKNKRDEIRVRKEENTKKTNYISENINRLENEISECKEEILTGEGKISFIQGEFESFKKASRNIITKIMNFSYYRLNKKRNFENEIRQIQLSNDIELNKIEAFVNEENKLKGKKYNLNKEKEELLKEYKQIEKEREEFLRDLEEINFICEFNEIDDKGYWSYESILDMYGHSIFNLLNQELFRWALRLNEAYIIKNSEEIIENLRLFLNDSDEIRICQKFFDSKFIYNKEKEKGIRTLWNTLFLCFPVITTTLDSFSKRCFHMIPKYIDLELIDEAGQILPHNLVPALYRGKRALIVGDVNQIEPIYSKMNYKFLKHQKLIGENFKDIEVEENSVQLLANRNTDVLDNGELVVLNNHYRCERNIVNFSNINVYNNKLNMNVEDDMDKPFFNNMVALDVRGRKENGENINKAEVQSCVEAVKYIQEINRDKECTIAIITPFKKQKKEIEDKLDKEGIRNVAVGTVHAFQGQERDYIIFSQVLDSMEKRSLVNFIGKKKNMLNVSVTRAKKQFIFLGNLEFALNAKNYLTKLINYIKENGAVYSLYDFCENVSKDTCDKNILKILQPELNIENDSIGLYIQSHIKDGVIIDSKEHYEFLSYAIKNAKKEICIMSPWYASNVINEEFLENIKRLKENDCKIKILFGYKKGNKDVASAKELASELKRTYSLGFITEEEAREIADKMYEIIGRENFVYAPPTHAKALIIDDKYMCIGSHNWLSNAGRTNEKYKAKETSVITTSKASILYVKEELFY